jgi:hypothetical protein
MGFHCSFPAPPLDALIEKIWDWDMPAPAHHYERVLPLPGAALIINLHEDETRVYADDATRHCKRSAAAVLGGPMLRSQIIDTAEQIRVMGVVFQPGGVHAFTAEDLAGMAGRDVDFARSVWRDGGPVAPAPARNSGARATAGVAGRLVAATLAHPGDKPCDQACHRGLESGATGHLHSADSSCHRHVRSSFHHAVQSSGRHETEALCAVDALSRGDQSCALSACGELERRGCRLRVCRPGPPEPRIPQLCRGDPVNLHGQPRPAYQSSSAGLSPRQHRRENLQDAGIPSR